MASPNHGSERDRVAGAGRLEMFESVQAATFPWCFSIERLCCLQYYLFYIICLLTPLCALLVIAWGMVNCSSLALALHYYFAKQMFPPVIICSIVALWIGFQL